MANYKRPRPHAHNYDVDKYKYVYIPLQAQGWEAIVHASDQGDVAIEDLITTVGAGNPSFGEIGSTGIAALKPDAAGDMIGLTFNVPYDCDVESGIDFAVQWSSTSTTTTDTATFKVEYTKHTIDTTALATGATALSTVIAADTNVAGASAIQQTAWGTINGGTLTNGDFLALNVECDAVSGMAATTIGMYNLVIRYVRRAL